VVMSSSTLGVIVTDAQGEIEKDVDVEVKVRVQVDSAVPPKMEKEKEPEPTVSPQDPEPKPDIRNYTVKSGAESVNRLLDRSRTLYVLGQDELIYIVGMDGEPLDHEKCVSLLTNHWRKESLDNLDAEDRKLIQEDLVTLLPFEVAVEIQHRLIDILERTYGIPILMAESGSHTYYLPLVDREGTPYDPSLIACLNWELWKTSKNVLSGNLTQLINEEDTSVLTMKQALIKQQHISK
jgi:hypothetical protein